MKLLRNAFLVALAPALAVAAGMPASLEARKRPMLTNRRVRRVPACRVKDPPAAAKCRAEKEKKVRAACIKAARRKARRFRPRQPGCASPKRTQTGLINLMNVHTNEVLAVGRTAVRRRLVSRFLRCRWTGRHGWMDLKVFRALIAAARHFKADTVTVFSGYRHPKFNEYLRKKCRQVARRSKHTLGRAVDFRLEGVDMDLLHKYLLSLKFGGVGYYRGSRFIHLDSGPVRTWKGL